LAVGEAGADAAGFVFAESPRRVSPEQATELAALLPPDVDRVAVFHHPSADDVAAVLSAFPADIVQCEPTDELRRAAAAAGARLLPVLHDGPELDALAGESPKTADGPAAILEAAGKGGRGHRPDWERAARLARRLPLVLAGGLGPGNVADAIHVVCPFGVDVSSGVEETRGHKDPVRIAAFVQAARTAAEATRKSRPNHETEPGMHGA
ncbi:MAG: phosphoribosylanthranilate isomerase, partial [marine benthic group bacterium]|nr:phosphoribosylanthranilate isomerase [Gemmatimonadota bacterium]